ncbi:RNA methyltransferase [Herbidospora galbida]|uniref:RNA methyltransferase n=1 Tax=Herbidospora galbida TaxID=2575442 RepID=A0A4U3LXP6_9ACTN|nr:N-6 DNA methylase [Herbidospora galbida]TKK80720.1 RNA methyltransferase [Herbidospora galbida]
MPSEFLVRTVTGLEDLTAAEITEAGHRVVDVTKRQLVVEAAGPIVTRLADDLFAVHASVPDPGRTKAGLWQAVARLTAHLAPDSPISVTASFTGARNFSRYDIEDAVGARLGVPYFSRRHGAPPPPGTADLRVTLDGKAMWLGVRPHAVPLHRRAWRKATVVGSLHPPVAAAMARLADIRPGHVVFDPCCGAGTLLIEAKHLEPGASYRGDDIDPVAIRAARLNDPAIAWRTGAGKPDRILANPPWGVRLPVAEDLSKRWPEAGRLVAILGEGQRLDRRWTTVGEYPLSVAGRRVRIVVALIGK